MMKNSINSKCQILVDVVGREEFYVFGFFLIKEAL